jgi:hypothetical protein
MKNDVALCFAALEVIAREAPANDQFGRRDDIRARILAPLRQSGDAIEREIREGAVVLLDAARSRR